MPLDMKTTRTVTRTVTLELTEAEIEEAIRQYVISEQRKLKDWEFSIAFKDDAIWDGGTRTGGVGATVTATTTAERGS